MTPERDEISGEMTTGHEWNGIKELNTPPPKVFRIWMWSSIAVCVVFWILYPAWPYVKDYTPGILGYSSREAVAEAVAQGAETRALAFARFENEDVIDLAQDPTLQAEFAPTIGALYEDKCAACHGRDLQGQTGFPNLTDRHWLWSGTPDEIEWTLTVGINADHDETRYAEMPAFGRDEMLEWPEIEDIADYVLHLSGQDASQEAVTRGQELFVENCAACHGDEGEGGLESGAPSLVDDSWIYGGSREDILKTLDTGRAGVMPAWQGKLSAAEIRMLTLYVLWAGKNHGPE